MKGFFLINFFLLLCNLVSAQSQYTIAGRVVDADNDEGLPFCNVFFANTTVGTSTDVDGYFSITTDSPHDSLMATYVGYNTLSIAVPNNDTNYFELNFRMIASTLNLDEVIILAGENPANEIVRNIIKNKEKNSLGANDNFRCEMYEKVELDLINIDTNLQKTRLMRPFEFIWTYFDSTSDERPFLPLYLTEQLFDNYYVKDKSLKTILKAQKTSGIKNETVTEFVSRIYEPVNTSKDWIYVMEKGFASPFSSLGLFYYEYYIQDSSTINGQWCYKLKFKPKRRQENTFYGDFWVADTTFAIERVSMRMSPDVNINLVNRVIIFEQSDYINGRWLPVKQKITVDYTLTDKVPGMIGRKTLTYRDYRLNEQLTAIEFVKQDPENYDINELKKDDKFWIDNRHEELTKSEKTVYAIVDSIKNVPVYKTYVDWIYTIVAGYKELGKIEIGPYFNVYNQNYVEGHRFSLGARSSTKLSDSYRFSLNLAYGTRDQRWKYDGSVKWRIRKRPFSIVGARYRNDVAFTSDSSEEIGLGEGTLLGGFYRRPIIMKMVHTEETKFFYEQWWKAGWSGRLTVLQRNIDPYGRVNPDGGGFNYGFISNLESPSTLDTIINDFEVIAKLRFAFKEKFVDGLFERTTLGSRFPIVELQYTRGIKGILSGSYAYNKLTFAIQHYVYLNPFGWTSYRIKLGKVWGTAPFLLLEVPPGNETFFYNKSAYNGMNRYEFATDAYAALHILHHFDGYFLNKIPLLRKLKWREVVGFKALIGRMSNENLAHNAPNLYTLNDLNTYTGFRVPTKPYMETMIGIENIFKVLRVDAIWRLSYLDNPQASRFNLRVGLDFYF